MRKEGVVWKIFNALVIVMGLLLILGFFCIALKIKF